MIMVANLSAALQRLFIKFILSQVVMLVALVSLAVLSTSYYKGKLAGQLSSAFRFPILSGDTRQVMYDMSDSVTKNFNFMEWHPASNQGGFTIPAGTNNTSRLIYSYTATPLSFDEKDRIAAGRLYFYYNRWPSIEIACVAWTLLFFASCLLIGAERRRIVRDYNMSIDLKVKESQILLAAQVAHDIRSPLVALDAALENTTALPEKQRIIVRHSLNRIRDVANALLERNRGQQGISAANPYTGERLEVRLLSSLIDPVIAEKRMQYASKPGIDIDFKPTWESYGLFSALQPVEFGRLLSNLINNAVDALDGKGKVDVRLTPENGNVLLSISDNGKGIPPEVLAKLGRKGETHGKAGGSGLGLFHARTMVESWGGTLAITSTPGKGTTVTIKLPKAEAPSGFVATVELIPSRPVVVLDDDKGIHSLWQKKLETVELKENNIEIIYFSEPATLRAWVKVEPAKAKAALYLFDYELSGHNETGLSLAEELGLCPHTIIVSGRSEEKQLTEDCARLKVRIIPKSLLEFVPVKISAARQAVLIDDDQIVHMNWETAAEEAGIELRSYKDPAEFLAALGSFSKTTPVYIDSELGVDSKGEDVAVVLKEKGFTNLTLVTGYSPERFAHLSWLKVRGKESPWRA